MKLKFQNHCVTKILLMGLLGLCSSEIAIAQKMSWMSVGALHSWYSNYGCEIEEGRIQQQQDGLRWPAIYRDQDMEAAKGFWIGTTNYKDKDGVTYVSKVVHIGPRTKGINEFFPVKFKLYSKIPKVEVTVDGNSSGSTSSVDPDSTDPSIKPDRILDNIANTAIGLTMQRKILGFSQKDQQNYIIYDYTFTNTGLIDDKGTKRDSVKLTGVYFYWQYRYAPCAETRYVIGNSTGWGTNTMIDIVGDSTGIATFPYGVTDNFNTDKAIRASFAWHGFSPLFTGGYDNIGGPIWNPYYAYQKGDTIGRLGAAQFVGIATLYAQKSVTDTSDDKSQPRTTSWEGSDEGNNGGNDPAEQYNIAKMNNQYAWMIKGHQVPHHAIKTGEKGDPSQGSVGNAGWSNANGYGPYDIGPGQSIRIVMAEAVGGLDRKSAIEIGRLFKNAGANKDAALLSYNGTSKTKNQWVYTGHDSLFKAFRAAMNNFASGYTLGAPVLPPASFTITSGAGKINIAWGTSPSVGGSPRYQLWRATGQYDSTYYKIFDGSANSYADTSASVDVAQYYYVLAVTPGGDLSNRYYTQTYDPAYRRLAASPALIKNNIRVVPNPYNINADPSRLLYSDIKDKVVFKNIPSLCTIKIYSELGELVKTIDHVNDPTVAGTGSQDYDLTTMYGQVIVSGVYIAVIETPAGERAIVKFVVIR